MIFHTFGDTNNHTIMLIHGVLTPWQIWDDAIRHFSKEYCVIVPALDAHTEEEQNIFESIDKEVSLIEEHIIKNHGGKLFMVCGLSMGGLIAAKLAAKSSIKIEALVLDGAPLKKVPGIAVKIMQNNYISIIRRSKKRDPEIIESFKKTFLPPKYLDPYLKIADNMTDESIRNMIGSVFKGFDFLSFNPDMKILFMHGTKGNEFISRKAAIKLKKINPQTEIRCYKNHAHAQLACFEPQKWINEVEDFMQKISL